MPCCAPRYGPLIISAIDTATGTAGLILLGLFRDSPSAWLCILFPALLMLSIGPTLTFAFLKRNTLLTLIAFWMNIILVIGCALIILTMWTAHKFRASSYTPLFIAAEFYVIILQLHFSWVVHDFHAHRLRFLAPFGSRKFQSIEEIDSYQQVIIT